MRSLLFAVAHTTTRRGVAPIVGALRLPQQHRELVKGANAGRVAKDGAGLDRVVRDATVPFPQGDTELEAGEVRPEASVNARTEGEVAVDVAVPTDVTGVGTIRILRKRMSASQLLNPT